jgi:AraC family L-rhamnose operon transcriptional activator RhaR
MKIFRFTDYLKPSENISIQKNEIKGSEPIHTHEFLELVYIYEGDGRQVVSGKSYSVHKGDLVFINYNQTHAFACESKMIYYNYLLRPEFMSGSLLDAENIYDIFALSLFDEFGGEIDCARPMVSFRGRELIEIEGIIQNMFEEFTEKSIGYKSVMKGYMQVIFAKMIRQSQNSNKKDLAGYIHKITPNILKYIDDNLFQKLTLVQLAEKCFYNPSYFSRVFKQCYGKSLTSYICERRMNEAMRLLKQTDLPIESVCGMVGYSDKAQFYKAFKKHSGTTPGEFRGE